MRGVLVSLLIAMMILIVTPANQAIQEGGQILWTGSGTGASQWEQGYFAPDGAVDIVEAGIDLESCFDDAGRETFLFRQFEVATPSVAFRSTGVSGPAYGEEGLLVETEITGTLADDSHGYESKSNGCFGGEAWVRFGNPTPLEHFTYRFGFSGAANWTATAWITLDDGQVLSDAVHESGEGTFFFTHEDLDGPNEVRTPGVTASLRADASVSVDLATGPQAMLWAFDTLAHYNLTAPDGTSCQIRDTVLVHHSDGDCDRFRSGSGAGTYTATLDLRAGEGRGDFLWAGIDAPPIPSVF